MTRVSSEINDSVVQIQQASTQFSDNDRQFTHDMKIILDRDSHIIGLTELHRSRIDLARELCDDANYKLVAPQGRGDCAIAISRDLGATVADRGADLAIKANPLPARLGGHSTRANVWCTFKLPDLGMLSMNVNHWNTGSSRSIRRHQQVMRQIDVLAARAESQGRGQRIAFFSGDLNVDPNDKRGRKVYNEFEEQNLVPIFEALDKWPPTHGRRTIDIVGHYDRDQRVTPLRLKVWPDQTRIDHQQVSAWYRIKHMP